MIKVAQRVVDELTPSVENKQAALASGSLEALSRKVFQGGVMNSDTLLDYELLSDVLENAPAALVVTRVADGRILFANQRFRNLMFDGRSEGIPEISPDYYVNPEDRTSVIAELRDTGRVVDREVQFRQLTGNVIWTLMNMSRITLGNEAAILSHLSDISGLKAMEAELRHANLVYDKLISASPDSIFIVDVNGVICFASPRSWEMFGIDPQSSMVGTSILEWAHEEEHSRLFANARKAGEGARDWASANHYKMVKKDGGTWWSEINSEAMIDADGDTDGIRKLVSIVRDVTEKHELQEKLEFQAGHDNLTGLPNRMLFYDRANVMLENSRRHSSSFALLFIDLNGFKLINDGHGHAMGDAVLKDIAERLGGAFRKSDTTARLGGDEFVVLIGDIASSEDVVEAANKIAKVLDEPSNIIPELGSYSASIGYAIYPDHGKTVDDLVKVADTMMYQVKRGAEGSSAVYPTANE